MFWLILLSWELIVSMLVSLEQAYIQLQCHSRQVLVDMRPSRHVIVHNWNKVT